MNKKKKPTSKAEAAAMADFDNLMEEVIQFASRALAELHPYLRVELGQYSRPAITQILTHETDAFFIKIDCVVLFGNTFLGAITLTPTVSELREPHRWARNHALMAITSAMRVLAHNTPALLRIIAMNIEQNQKNDRQQAAASGYASLHANARKLEQP